MTNRSSTSIRNEPNYSWSNSCCRSSKCIGSKISQQFVPNVVWILLHFRDDGPHTSQHRGFLLFVDITLQELQHVEPILGIQDERSKQDIETVIHGDEVVPVLGTPPDRGLEVLESLPLEIAF